MSISSLLRGWTIITGNNVRKSQLMSSTVLPPSLAKKFMMPFKAWLQAKNSSSWIRRKKKNTVKLKMKK